MEIAAKDGLILLAALTITVLGILRVPAALRGHNISMVIAHLALAFCLAIRAEPVYLAVDQVLGGRNLASLLAYLLLPVVFLAAGRQVARGLRRPDLERWLVGPPGLTILLLHLSLTTVTFVMIGATDTSPLLREYRELTAVTVYRAVGYLYCAYVAGVLALPVLRLAREHYRPVHQRCAQIALGVAFIGVACLPVVYLAELVHEPTFLNVGRVLVYGCALVGISSPAILFVARRRRLNRDRF